MTIALRVLAVDEEAGKAVDALERPQLAAALERGLANMRELAEITTQSQKEAFDVVRKRIEENVAGIRNLGKKARK